MRLRAGAGEGSPPGTGRGPAFAAPTISESPLLADFLLAVICPQFSEDGKLPASLWEQESPLNINEFISEFVVDIDFIPVAYADLVSLRDSLLVLASCVSGTLSWFS